MKAIFLSTVTILVVFEFPSLNGGELSLLSSLKRIRCCNPDGPTFRFIAAGPDLGSMAYELRQLAIPVLPFKLHNSDGTRRSPSGLQMQLHSILKSSQPDIVHSNSLSMARHVGRMSAEVFGKTIRTGHLRDIIKLSRTAIQDLNQNDGLIAVSDATRNFHVANGLDADICTTIHNGIDLQIFRKANTKQCRSKWFSQLPDNAIVILNVGQICLRKGQRDLAEAVVELLPDFQNLHLAVAGSRHSKKAESIEFEQSIHQTFEAAERSNHLHMLGQQDDVASLMNAADMLVHSAKQEPLGRVLLEAAACRLPVVATDVGGTSEIFGDSKHALLVSPGPQQLASGIRQVLNHPDAADQRARTAFHRIETDFPINKATRRLAAFWENLFMER